MQNPSSPDHRDDPASGQFEPRRGFATDEKTEAEAYFAALDYAYDRIGLPSPARLPAPLPAARVVHRGLLARLVSWLNRGA
jgi:hypothetical protein